MYNPLSLYTVLPWAIIFNVAEALIMIILDTAIGEAFNDTVKGSLSLILFILNFIYMIYTVVIHFSVLSLTRKPSLKEEEARDKLYPITFVDLFNILVGASLTWVWLFMALYFFDHTMYTNVLVSSNQPRTFFKVYFKFYAYTLIALNGGATTIFPIITLSEVAQGFAVLYYQITTILVLAGFLSYLNDIIVNSNVFIPKSLTSRKT